MLRISDGSASRLIGDALDLRHRLPSIWAATQAGQVPAYQARRIASATRHLTAEQAARWISDSPLHWVRCRGAGCKDCCEAAIIAADPDAAEQAAAAAAQERFVRLGCASEHGLKLIIARATAGDAIWFKATIDRIADILGQARRHRHRRRTPLQSHRHPRPTRPSPATALPAPTRQLGRTAEPADAEAEPASDEITLMTLAILTIQTSRVDTPPATPR